jgi:polyhydroxybutyrate depolymerase
MASLRPWSTLWLLGCLAGCAPQAVVSGRPYTLSVPGGAGSTPLPLLVLLHGYSATAEAEDLVLPFSKQVDARRFLYAQPEGTRDKKGKRFWNATDACCDFDAVPVDDVAFVRALIADVKANHPVDPARIFVVGHSNGGFMALRLACELGDEVSGVASLAGAAWLDPRRCPSGKPVSALEIHGTADDVIGYNGGATEEGGEYPSAAVTVATMAARNGCTGARARVGDSDFLDGPDPETARDAFGGCPAGGHVELWTVSGAGHIPFFDARLTTAVLDWLEAARK